MRILSRKTAGIEEGMMPLLCQHHPEGNKNIQ